jgi:hypothetical protein
MVSGLAHLNLDSTGIVYGKNDKWKLGAYYILEYDRDIYKNLDYLGFTPIHTGIPSFVIPRQISLIINIHIHHTSSSGATVFYIGEVTTLSARWFSVNEIYSCSPNKNP